MRTEITPADVGAIWANVDLARSMIQPSWYGPRSATRQVVLLPFDVLVTLTIVPIGSVLWAHVPSGAASYHDALPDSELPDGAGAGAAVVGVARRAVVVVVALARTTALAVVVVVVRRTVEVVVGATEAVTRVTEAAAPSDVAAVDRSVRHAERLARGAELWVRSAPAARLVARVDL
jgi:hypothetical protein